MLIESRAVYRRTGVFAHVAGPPVFLFCASGENRIDEPMINVVAHRNNPPSVSYSHLVSASLHQPV